VIQFCYPQVYFACHMRHDRARSNHARASARDGAILVHLDTTRATNLTALARHLGLAASTMSEAVSRLHDLGFVEKATAAAGDRRSIGIRLTSQGAAAVQAGSVLESARLHAVLRRLTPPERRQISRAFQRLAAACRPGRRDRRA